MPQIIHLIDCGDIEGIPSSELQVGMRLMWNYGNTYDVLAIQDKSAQFIEVLERSTETGREYKRRLKKSRIVAAYWPKPMKSAPKCELCGEPAGEGNALCPACQETR